VLIDPELVRARSSREHYCTLLHYVAANGVENWRQRTPRNIVEVAEALLDNGAEVDAVAQMYGGDCTTLGLAATSIHPERAGVQIPLLQLLLDRGARVDRAGSAGGTHSLIKSCFANGRGQAAEFLSRHCPSLDLEEAAGTGHLDAVRGFFNDDGTLKPSASQEQLRQGIFWSCQFGRNRVVEYLLSLGFDLSAQDRNGQSALHHAVIGAQLETVALLLRHRAPLEVKNSYGGTALGQAVWCALNADSARPYLPVIERLLQAGAQIEPGMEDALARLLRRRPGSHR
jgi:ankyrin repeat protein